MPTQANVSSTATMDRQQPGVVTTTNVPSAQAARPRQAGLDVRHHDVGVVVATASAVIAGKPTSVPHIRERSRNAKGAAPDGLACGRTVLRSSAQRPGNSHWSSNPYQIRSGRLTKLLDCPQRRGSGRRQLRRKRLASIFK